MSFFDSNVFQYKVSVLSLKPRSSPSLLEHPVTTKLEKTLQEAGYNIVKTSTLRIFSTKTTRSFINNINTLPNHTAFIVDGLFLYGWGQKHKRFLQEIIASRDIYVYILTTIPHTFLKEFNILYAEYNGDESIELVQYDGVGTEVTDDMIDAVEYYVISNNTIRSIAILAGTHHLAKSLGKILAERHQYNLVLMNKHSGLKIVEDKPTIYAGVFYPLALLWKVHLIILAKEKPSKREVLEILFRSPTTTKIVSLYRLFKEKTDKKEKTTKKPSSAKTPSEYSYQLREYVRLRASGTFTVSLLIQKPRAEPTETHHRDAITNILTKDVEEKKPAESASLNTVFSLGSVKASLPYRTVRNIVIYQGYPSIVLRAYTLDPNALFMHLWNDKVFRVLKTIKDKDENYKMYVVHILYSRKFEKEASEIIRFAKSLGYRVVTYSPPPKWYDKYIRKYLIDVGLGQIRSRVLVRLMSIKRDEYQLLREIEFETIRNVQWVVARAKPEEINGLKLLFTNKRVPTPDVARLYAYKMKTPVCVTSPRDTGLAITCIGSRELLEELTMTLIRHGVSLHKDAGNIVTGYLVTFPSPPQAGLDIIRKALSAIPVTNNILKVPDNITPDEYYLYPLPTYESYTRYLYEKLKHTLKRKRFRKRKYVLLEPNTFTGPIYARVSRYSYKVYLPISEPFAVVYEWEPLVLKVAGLVVTPEEGRGLLRWNNNYVVLLRRKKFRDAITYSIENYGYAIIKAYPYG